MDVMFDIETLSTTPEAVVLSVGAVKFLPMGGVESIKDKQHWRLEIDSQMDKGREVSESTMEWWAKQDIGVRAEVFAPDNRIPLDQFFAEFNRYMTGAEKIWCQGPQFDAVIMENLYRQYQHHWNWQYWQITDSRTLLATCKILDKNYIDPRKGMQQNLHNAADDSYYQALSVQQMLMDIGR